MNRDFEVRLGPVRMLAVAAKLAVGRLGGGLSKTGFRALLDAMSAAAKIRTHYEAFPDDPARFDEWALCAAASGARSSAGLLLGHDAAVAGNDRAGHVVGRL